MRLNSTDSESTGLVVQHALSSDFNAHNKWILDSGATCHMCNQESLFTHYQPLQKPLMVVFGDGRSLQAIGRGCVVVRMNLPNFKTNKCILLGVQLVLYLAFNLFSVTSASEKVKLITFL